MNKRQSEQFLEDLEIKQLNETIAAQAETIERLRGLLKDLFVIAELAEFYLMGELAEFPDRVNKAVSDARAELEKVNS